MARQSPDDHVAILHPHPDATRLAWHDLTASGTHAVPAVHGFDHVALDTDEAGRHASVARVARRHIGWFQRAEGLFRPGALAVGDRALCETTGSEELPQYTPFCRLHVNGRPYFVYGHGVRRLPSLGDLDRVTIVSAICLFSDRALSLITARGERLGVIGANTEIEDPIRAIVADDRLTLYELESVARLARFTADLVAALPEGPSVTVTLGEPRVQYYHILLGLYWAGLVEPELLLEWFEIVDRRRARVLALHRAQLELMLAERGVSDRVQMRPAANSDAFATEIGEQVRAGRVPQVETILKRLVHVHPIWRRCLRVRWPRTYRDLANDSYTIELLRDALSSGGNTRQMAIQVENHPERKVFTNAEQLAEQLKRTEPQLHCQLAGLYPLEPVFTASPDTRSSIYLADPGHRFVEADGKEHSAIDLVDLLHGVRVREPLDDAHEPEAVAAA